MKKYKYSRKEALRIARDSGYGYKTFEKYLLAKESNEEETHYFAACGNKLAKKLIKKGILKQEDNKDQRYVYCCPVHGEYYKVCPKCNPTPSPLDKLKKIEPAINYSYDELDEKVNEIIKTLNLIIKQLKQK